MQKITEISHLGYQFEHKFHVFDNFPQLIVKLSEKFKGIFHLVEVVRITQTNISYEPKRLSLIDQVILHSHNIFKTKIR